MSKHGKPSCEELEATVADLQEKYLWALKRVETVETTGKIAQYAAEAVRQELLLLRAEVARNKSVTLN